MKETDAIKLSPAWESRHKKTRFIIYLVFLLGLFYATYLILFPSANFIFSFKNPDSSKNTVVEPRNNNDLIRNGKISGDNRLTFDTNPLGDFSEIELSFTLDSKSADIKNGNVSVRRSYRSFFYPEGEAINSLDNIETIKLLSANNSVFLASQGKIWPIADAITFSATGFYWSDVVPSSSEEISLYEKQKLFTLKSPHPNGTVFFDKDSRKYYLIENKEKREIKDTDKLSLSLEVNPITAENKGLETKSRCQLKKSFSFSKKYGCKIFIDNMENLSGNDYQFEADFGQDAKIQNINATFKKTFNVKNFRSSLALLKNRVTANYYGQDK